MGSESHITQIGIRGYHASEATMVIAITTHAFFCISNDAAILRFISIVVLRIPRIATFVFAYL